jgi:hypothetical protein
VGFMAQNAMGHTWRRVFIALHLVKKPLIVRLAPALAGIAVGIATAAALLRFYNWCQDLCFGPAQAVEKQPAYTAQPAQAIPAAEQRAPQTENG